MQHEEKKGDDRTVMTKREMTFVVLILLLALGVVQAFEFNVLTQSDFNLGSYINTEYNLTGSFLQLSFGNTTGNYTSTVIDGEDLSQWQNLILTTNLVTQPLLLSVDLQDDVWTSRNGVDWTFLTNDYNAGDGGNDAQYTFADFQDYLYSIESDDDVWRSLDRGRTWAKINDDYNGEVQHVVRAAADLNNNLYIIEGDEDVWKSTNGGGNWTKINGTDFNGGNGNVFGLVVNSSNVLLAVDNSQDVWATNDGIIWTLTADNYNAAEANNPNYMFIDNQDLLYIVEDDDDIWQSNNSGLNWSKISDDYNGETQRAVRVTVDSTNNFYLIEGDEDVWKSTNGGGNWTKINGTDFNGGNGNVAGLSALNSTTNVTLSVRSCALNDCSDGTFVDTGYSLNIATNRYFQFLLTLTADKGDITPQVFNVSVQYADVGVPNTTNISPATGNFMLSDIIDINVTVSDGKHIDTVLINLTLPDATSTLLTLSNTSLYFYNISYAPSLIGNYSFTVLANDTSNNLNNTESGSFVLQNTPDTTAPTITIDTCTPNPSTIGEDVTCDATITDNQQIATVQINLTLPDNTVAQPLVVNISTLYSFTYNASQVGNISVLWTATDTSNNTAQDTNQQYTIVAANQSSGSNSGSNGNSGSSGNGGDQGPGALRNAPPGTPVIGNSPQPRQQQPSRPPQGETITQQPRTTDSNALTGAAVGAQDEGMNFKKISILFLSLALLFFVISYFLRQRRRATKHLYINKRPRKIMVKDVQLLDKLQGYVSAEVLDKLKKGDHLHQKRVDPKDKEFAHQFPETAKELQEKNIQIHPKKFNYERLEQAKRNIHKESKSISASDMKKIFPETLGKLAKLQEERFVLTPRSKELAHKSSEEDFSKHFVIKPIEKPVPVEPKQSPQTSRKINKTSKDQVLKGLQEVYKIE